MNNIKFKKTRNNFSGNNSFSQPGKGQKNRGKKIISNINPDQLIRKSTKAEQLIFSPALAFNQMSLHSKIKYNLAQKGYKYPTRIQEETHKFLIEGRDMVGVANTGTGKTGAFLIPIIEQLLNTTKPFKSLVIVPTRELALQVEEEFKSLSKGMGLFTASFIGGTNVERDLKNLKKANHLFIGTPGRLIDLANRQALHLQDIQVLVLDEFDRMLDMGFVNDIKKIVSGMKNRRQTMLFSATIDPAQNAMIQQMLTDPVEINVGTGALTSNQIEQDIIRVPQGSDKFKMLLNLIGQKEFEKVLIFAETKRMVDKVNKKLNRSGVKSELIHGNKSQNYRNNALNKFKSGNVQVLVATDVAARGIDVMDITHVINYQLPVNFDSYIHRIGRTGRAGKTGKAFTFVD